MCGCREITAEVFAERDRGVELDRLQVLFNLSPSFLALLRGPDHVYEMVNPSYMQLIGNRDVIGRPVRDVVPEVEAQGYIALLDKVYRTGLPYSASAAEIYLQRMPDAAPERRLLDLLFQPMRNAAGEVTGIMVNGNDVTEIHAAQEQLRLSEMRNRTEELRRPARWRRPTTSCSAPSPRAASASSRWTWKRAASPPPPSSAAFSGWSWWSRSTSPPSSR